MLCITDMVLQVRPVFRPHHCRALLLNIDNYPDHYSPLLMTIETTIEHNGRQRKPVNSPLMPSRPIFSRSSAEALRARCANLPSAAMALVRADDRRGPRRR